MMKSMEEYVDSVYAKYEESERNHEVYKKVRMTRKRPLATLCGITACLLLVCVCVVGYNRYGINQGQEPDNQVFAENEEKIPITYTKFITVNGAMSQDKLKRMIERAEIIALVNDFNEIGVKCQINDKKVYLQTDGVFCVNKIFKGEELIDNNNVEYSTLGGTILFSDMQADSDYDWENWELLNFEKTIIEKENTYYRQILEKAEILEKGKQYLVFLVQDGTQKEKYKLTNNVYGIMEYDPATNMVKNIDTGEFEEFDWDLILGN